jgi:redox-sensitive bicupin YhaK (pirin superfamily)
MLPQSQGKIFLADERGLQEHAGRRRYYTFNADGFYNEHKTPFGALYALHEDTLDAEQSITLHVKAATGILLLPTVGAITWKDNTGQSGMVAAGQSLYYTAQQEIVLVISNPYENALVNFLQWWFKHTAAAEYSVLQLTDFDLKLHKDQLLPLGCQAWIGKFNGRAEAVHTLAPDHGLFVFVLEGAFEVQYRLLNARDGLALWDVSEVELEALSNDAIVIIAAVPLQA